jgi:hypothetical protein
MVFCIFHVPFIVWESASFSSKHMSSPRTQPISHSLGASQHLGQCWAHTRHQGTSAFSQYEGTVIRLTLPPQTTKKSDKANKAIILKHQTLGSPEEWFWEKNTDNVSSRVAPTYCLEHLQSWHRSWEEGVQKDKGSQHSQGIPGRREPYREKPVKGSPLVSTSTNQYPPGLQGTILGPWFSQKCVCSSHREKNLIIYRILLEY